MQLLLGCLFYFVLLYFQFYSYSHDFTVLLPPWSHFLIIFHFLDDVHLLATFPSDSGYGRQRWRCHGWTFLANTRAYFYQSEDYGIHRLRDDWRHWLWVLSLHHYSGTSGWHFSPSVGHQSTVYCHILPPLQRLHPLQPLDTQLYHRLATAITHFPSRTHSTHHLFQDLGPGQSGSLFVCWGDQPTRDCSSIRSGVFLPQAYRWSPSG